MAEGECDGGRDPDRVPEAFAALQEFVKGT